MLRNKYGDVRSVEGRGFMGPTCLEGFTIISQGLVWEIGDGCMCSSRLTISLGNLQLKEVAISQVPVEDLGTVVREF